MVIKGRDAFNASQEIEGDLHAYDRRFALHERRIEPPRVRRLHGRVTPERVDAILNATVEAPAGSPR